MSTSIEIKPEDLQGESSATDQLSFHENKSLEIDCCSVEVA
jgi:hypothetical protein